MNQPNSTRRSQTAGHCRRRSRTHADHHSWTGHGSHGRRHPGRDRGLFGQPERRADYAPADRERPAGGDPGGRRADTGGVGQVDCARAHGRDARQRQSRQPRREGGGEPAGHHRRRLRHANGAGVQVRRSGAGFLLPAAARSAPRPRRRRLAVRPQGRDRSHAERPGDVPANTPRGYRLATHGGARADSVDDRHRRLGPLHPPAARRVRFHRRHRRSSRRPPRPNCRSISSSSPRRIPRSSCATTRASPACRKCRRCGRSATCSRIARSRARRGEVGREDDAREEAAVRRADLSRHRLHAVRLEHAQRRVHLEREELSRSEGDDRRAARASTSRSCCTSSSRPAPRPGQDAERQRERSVHRGTAPSRSHARRPVAARSPGQLLLAGAQAALRSRRRRLVARSGRRLRRTVASSRASGCTGKAASSGGRTSGRLRSIATATRACSGTARSSGRAT